MKSKLFQKKSSSDAIPSRRREGVNSSERREPLAPQSSYRRNRTLTGSSSARISSTNELNAERLSPRAHVHHLSKRRRGLFMHFILTLAVAGGLYFLLSQSIATVAVSAGSANLEPTRAREYEQRFQRYFDTYPTERVLFNVNQNQLMAYMTREYPEIATIRVDTTGMLGRAHAYLILRKPIAKWSLRNENNFVDQQGVVFAYNGYEPPSLQILDTTGIETSSGIVTSDRFLAFVGRVVGASKAQGYTVTEAIIPPLSTRQLAVKVEGVPYTIKYTIDRTAGEQAEDMARTIAFMTSRNLSPSYIDVRVQGRAAYK